LFLGWWFTLQFFNGTLSLLSDPGQIGGVAWWAHIGGFVFGALFCSILKVKHFYRRHHEEEIAW
jgi:membrane associated rhomboid family serine protease